MKKQIKKKVIIFFVVMCLLIPSVVRFAHAGGGADIQMSFTDPAVILTTVVFVMWNVVLMSAILHHSNLRSKRFSNPKSKKLYLIQPLGLLGLNPYTRLSLMTNPALVFALAFSKQRPAVTKTWSGNISLSSTVIDGQAKGLYNPIRKRDDSFFPITIRPKLQF